MEKRNEKEIAELKQMLEEINIENKWKNDVTYDEETDSFEVTIPVETVIVPFKKAKGMEDENKKN